MLGHEGAGVVERVGAAVTQVAPGDRVGMTLRLVRRTARPAATGRPAYCHDFFGHNFASPRADGTSALSRDGELIHGHFFGQSSFATHAVASERNVVTLPDSIPLEIAAPFGCGIQTGAGAVLDALRAPAGSTLAVFGTGAVGLSAIMAGVIAGCTTIIGIDSHPARLELARELGATHVDRRARAGRGRARSARITGFGADFSLETTGVPARAAPGRRLPGSARHRAA